MARPPDLSSLGMAPPAAPPAPQPEAVQEALAVFSQAVGLLVTALAQAGNAGGQATAPLLTEAERAEVVARAQYFEALQHKIYLTPEEVECLYPLSAATLRSKRHRRDPDRPPSALVHNRVVYHQGQLRNWLLSRHEEDASEER